VASLSQGRTAAAQCGLFTHKSVPVIFEPPCTFSFRTYGHTRRGFWKSKCEFSCRQLMEYIQIPKKPIYKL